MFTLIMPLFCLAYVTRQTKEGFTPAFSLLLLNLQVVFCYPVCLYLFRKQLTFSAQGTWEFSLLASGLLSDCFMLPSQTAGGGNMVKYSLQLNKSVHSLYAGPSASGADSIIQ